MRVELTHPSSVGCGQGEEVDDRGHRSNKWAPYTKLRVEVWSHDSSSGDKFIGEVGGVEHLHVSLVPNAECACIVVFVDF